MKAVVADDVTLEHQADLAVRPAIHLEQSARRDPQAGLLERLPHGRLARVLAAIDPAAGGGPTHAVAVIGLPHEQHTTVGVAHERNRADREPWIKQADGEAPRPERQVAPDDEQEAVSGPQPAPCDPSDHRPECTSHGRYSCRAWRAWQGEIMPREPRLQAEAELGDRYPARSSSGASPWLALGIVLVAVSLVAIGTMVVLRSLQGETPGTSRLADAT